MNTRSSSNGAAALDKGLGLLVALLDDGGARALPDVAATLGLPASTARRMAVVLERRGLLLRTGKGRFATGPVLARMPGGDERELLGQAARPILRTLARALSLTAHLGVLEDAMVTYVAKEHGRTKPIFTREDQQLEAYCSALGKVLLASLAEADREAYLAADAFIALTPRTITSSVALREELGRVRERGYAADDEEIADGLFCLGVPLMGPNGAVLAALSISGATAGFGRWSRESLLTRLRSAAGEIVLRLRP